MRRRSIAAQPVGNQRHDEQAPARSWPTASAACRSCRSAFSTWSRCSAPASTRPVKSDEVLQAAADVLCQDLRRKLTGRRPSDRYFRTATQLGQAIADGGFKSIAGLQPDEIMMKY